MSKVPAGSPAPYKPTVHIKELIASHVRLVNQIANAQVDKRDVEFQVMEFLLKENAMQCFSINWRAVHKRFNS